MQRYIKDWLLRILDLEQKQLSAEPDEKLLRLNAAERLKGVSHLLTKIRLAEQFGKLPSDIGKMKYSQVFTILVANKRQADLQKDYTEIK